MRYFQNWLKLGSDQKTGVTGVTVLPTAPQASKSEGFTSYTKSNFTKDESVTVLPQNLPGNIREIWEERAAILEFDAGYKREKAEILASLYIEKRENKDEQKRIPLNFPSKASIKSIFNAYALCMKETFA